MEEGFAAAMRYLKCRWKRTNPEIKLVWKVAGALFALLAFAVFVAGMALLIGPN